ncbi:DNA-binding protein [bacterium]|nr:DNA-binding protein [bacterium]
MKKSLTTSAIDRQNILNNRYAIETIQKEVGIKAVVYKNEYIFSKEQVARFFEIDERTIERYLKKYSDELSKNGYKVLRGKDLKLFKLWLEEHDVSDINVGHKVVNFGLFNFRAFLNLAMLLVESEKARILRSAILDIVIDTINQKTGGGTKYINQRDEDFVVNFLKGEDYRREFTDALRDYVEMGKVKYAIYTDKIYRSIFKENTQEYRNILRLHSKENVRQTMYSEILRLISSYEAGFAEELKKTYQKLGRKLKPFEVDRLFANFEKHRLWLPQVEDARLKMASRDLGFRDALHIKLRDYIAAIPPEDFEKFIGEKSKTLEEQLKAAKDVFKRLKERE